MYNRTVSMVLLGRMTKRNPFHSYVCDGCNRSLASHFVFRPDTYAEARGNDRTQNGKFYCNTDGTSHAGAYHQRELRRTMDKGYA